MSSSDNTDIRQAENELFARMAKVRQPMAPDLAPTQPVQASSPNIANLPYDHAHSQRARLKAEFPLLTDADLDELML